ncbi:hypothetical protein [Microtetraspora sp. NBRC 16547]|uniref:hypothetical protein n=1 Tax=Microtetraspora sp. NBRC 16547 TaxID=3030993 RepID=UPI002552CE5E|nr:hypothetical protein [Microtetraspora sp. NBRC 16547]
MHWDGFTAIERDVRAMVADPRWAALPATARAQAMAQRSLVTPDGSFWLFGTHARWYRQDRVDGRWHLSAPPALLAVRSAARPLPPATGIPPLLIPAGPDFAVERGTTQAFVGPDVPEDITERIRDLVVAHRRLRRGDFPLHGSVFRDVFAADVTGTVAAVWGTIMWCAYAPAFDGNEVLLSLFGEFLARPLPGDDWVRWLPPVPLDALVTLYAERMLAQPGEGGARLAGLLAGLIAETASVLRTDPRFRLRADTLLAMVGPAAAQPWLDRPAALAGAVRQAWLARRPPHLAVATLSETSPGEDFRHRLYDLVEALGHVAATGADPRAVAASLLAADVAAVSSGAATGAVTGTATSGVTSVVTMLYPWMDDEMRRSFYVALTDPAHPLRGCWPVSGELPAALTPPGRDATAALLGAAYATGLAWCRLAGTAPPPRGFPVSSAAVAWLMHQRDDTVPELPVTGEFHDQSESGWLFHR